MSTVQPTDKTLVNRAGVDHSAPADMSTVQDTDLLLINRAGVDYKCTFADWKASQANIKTPSITSPAAGAVDLGETPTFTSSAFSAVGAVTHVSSDWQVTLATDTAFASPVVQSMADATNKVRWDGGPLQANTDYIVRVRHNGTGISSAWSAVVTFKTKSGFVASLVPTDLLFLSHPSDVTGTTVVAPVKFVNFSACYRDHPVNGSADKYVFGVGTDGKLYAGGLANKAMVDTGFPMPAGTTSYAAVCGTWDPGNGVVVLYDTGKARIINANTGAAKGADLEGAFAIGYGNAICEVAWATKDDGTLWLKDTTFGPWSQLVPGGALAGRKLHSVAVTGGPGVSLASVREYVVLAEDGDAYKIPTADGVTPSSAPTLLASNVLKVTEDSTDGGGATRCLLVGKDGSLTVHVGPGGTGTPAANSEQIIFPPGSNIVDAFVSYKANKDGVLFSLKSDGSVWRSDSLGAGNVQVTGVAAGVLSSFGTLSLGTSGPSSGMWLPAGK